jgi:hypothetical protein
MPTSATAADLKREIFDYYDGYSWDGKNRVLNPFSLIKFIDGKEFKNFWFNTGTPTFLMQIISRSPMEHLRPESRTMDESMLNAVDVTNIKLTPLLFQTGYLTIERRTGVDAYVLKSPNYEVSHAFSKNILDFLTDQQGESIRDLSAQIAAALANFDSGELAKAFGVILRWVTHQQRRVGESFQHALIFVVLRAMGFDVVSEVSGSEGTFDVLIKAPSGTIFVCEFKHEKFEKEPDETNEEVRKKLLDKALGRAKEQIANRRYDAEYEDKCKAVKRLAVGFVGNSDVIAEIY